MQNSGYELFSVYYHGWRCYCYCFLLMCLQVTETRTGPLGCSNYDNLDTVSSVLVHSPENKIQLQGKNLNLIIFGRTASACSSFAVDFLWALSNLSRLGDMHHKAKTSTSNHGNAGCSLHSHNSLEVT